MARELDPCRALGPEVRRLVRRRLRASLGLLDDARRATGRGDGGPEVEDAVHLVRRHTKEIRAVLRLVDDLTDESTARLDALVQQAARSLSPVRDAHVMAAVAGRLTSGAAPDVVPDVVPGPAPAEVLDALERATRLFEEALQLTDDLRLTVGPRDLRRGLRRGYRACRRAYRRARRDPSPEHLHRWRIRNKRLWYQVRALSAASPAVLGPLAELLDRVGETLGDLHDLDVFLASLEAASDEGAPMTTPSFHRLEEERRAGCARALRWGSTIHAESDDAFASRLVGLWRIAATHGPEPAR